MIGTKVRNILVLVLGLSMVLSLMGSAQAARLTKKQKALMKNGRVEELARSLTRDLKGRTEKISRLYLFVRDNIQVFEFKTHRSASRVLRDGAGRAADKSRLLSKLLKAINERGYLATINLVRYGEDQSYSFVVVKATDKEAEAMSRATGGNGKFVRFPVRREGNKFIPLVPLSGHSIGQLSTIFYEEVEEGSGTWKKWKYNVNFARF